MYMLSAFQCVCLLTAIATISLITPAIANETGGSPPTIGSIERLDKALDAIVPRDAKIEIIGKGFEWSEGPVWVPDGLASQQNGAEGSGFLLFSDIPQNAIMRWDEATGISLWLKPAGYTGSKSRGGESGSNGLALDRKGRLVLCQHGDRRVARHDTDWDNPQPTFVTIADRYEGKRFNSPNDLVVHSSGAVYFTDPPYGLEKNMGDPAKELPYQGVFRASSDGEVTLLTKEVERPNGIAFSPDEQTLYIANSHDTRPVIMAFPVIDDGTLGEGREYFDARPLAAKHRGACDGMAVDEHGNVFATVPGGVAVISPDGKLLGMLYTTKFTSNCTFGEDGRTLFITADDLLLRIELSSKGIGF